MRSSGWISSSEEKAVTSMKRTAMAKIEMPSVNLRKLSNVALVIPRPKQAAISGVH
eukprot:SAG11_NODE_8804_length_974_cov_1.877714_2_plen_56_part_00